MKPNDYSGYGLRVRIEPQEGGSRMVWSGQSTWLAEEDKEAALITFLAEFQGEVDPSQVVEIHIQDLRKSNSSTIGLVANVAGPLLQKGIRLKLVYDDELHFQRELIEGMKRVLERYPDFGPRYEISTAKGQEPSHVK